MPLCWRISRSVLWVSYNGTARSEYPYTDWICWIAKKFQVNLSKMIKGRLEAAYSVYAMSDHWLRSFWMARHRMMDEQHVFVVDDDPAVRDSIRMLLESVPFPVLSFPSAHSFLNDGSAKNGCLVADVRMPDM